MLKVRIEDDTLFIGPHLSVTFQRTLRLPDDGKTYPLPPGLGEFPLRLVDEYADRVPPAWREVGGVMLPIYPREALWLSFNYPHFRSAAVKVAAGKINAITGQPWSDGLSADPQDYVVVPDQQWLDGINNGDGTIRQFVAVEHGRGHTIEAQVSGKEEHGGLQLICYEPKAGKFPEEDPVPRWMSRVFRDSGPDFCCAPEAAASVMGLAAGGKMTQKIYPDGHGIDTWDQERFGRVFVHLCNSRLWETITGKSAPPSPISAETYSGFGLPWFALDDQEKSSLGASEALEKVSSLGEIDAREGVADPEDAPVDIPAAHVKTIGAKHVKDKGW